MKVEATIHFKRRGNTKKIKEGVKQVSPGRIPRVTKLMAPAVRFEGLIASGEVADYAELARLAHVSRARITQIMNLLILAPENQEALLFLPLVEKGATS